MKNSILVKFNHLKLLGHYLINNAHMKCIMRSFQQHELTRYLQSQSFHSISSRKYGNVISQHSNTEIIESRPISCFQSISMCLSLSAYSQKNFVSVYKLGSNDKNTVVNRRSPIITLDQCRNKHKKTEKRPEYDSDSDSDEEDEVIQGTKILHLHLQSTRLDGLLKKALAYSRAKIDESFFEGNIRVNGKKPNKKSIQLKIGDEVDLIRGLSPVNSKLLSISRVELISVKESNDDDEDKLTVKVRRTKSLFVENYEEAPWKKVAVAE